MYIPDYPVNLPDMLKPKEENTIKKNRFIEGRTRVLKLLLPCESPRREFNTINQQKINKKKEGRTTTHIITLPLCYHIKALLHYIAVH